MSQPLQTRTEGAQTILHPTDLSEESMRAFAHALKVALLNKALLSILHVSTGRTVIDWSDSVPVRSVLDRWNLLEKGAHRSEIAENLGVRIRKLTGYDKSVTRSIIRYEEINQVDLLVLASHRSGLPGWLSGSISEPIAGQMQVPTLLVPADSYGCVSMDDGEVFLNNVLIPVDHYPRPDPALERAMRAIAAFGKNQPTITLLHVGEKDEMPDIDLPESYEWQWSRVVRSGNPVNRIVETANDLHADLIVMVTEGRKNILDAVRGSTTEQVIRRSPCPILVVPST